jgi:hypothetical protein
MRVFLDAIQDRGGLGENFDGGGTVARSCGVGEGEEELVLRLGFERGHRFASQFFVADGVGPGAGGVAIDADDGANVAKRQLSFEAPALSF